MTLWQLAVIDVKMHQSCNMAASPTLSCTLQTTAMILQVKSTRSGNIRIPADQSRIDPVLLKDHGRRQGMQFFSFLQSLQCFYTLDDRKGIQPAESPVRGVTNFGTQCMCSCCTFFIMSSFYVFGSGTDPLDQELIPLSLFILCWSAWSCWDVLFKKA